MEDAMRSPETLVVRRKTEDGEWKLEVLGAPYGGPVGGKDYQGDSFSDRTDFMLDIGDERPVLYYHGDNPDGRPEMKPDVIGKARAIRRDDKGLWFEVALDKTKRFASRVMDAARDNVARASTGTVNYLVRRSADGELLQWPIAELSLLDAVGGRMPANPYATVSVKAMFTEAGLAVPEAFMQGVGDTPEMDAEQSKESDGASEALAVVALYDRYRKSQTKES